MRRDEASAATGYADNPLDRRADLRGADDAVGALKTAAARVLVFAADKAVLKRGEPLDPLFDLAETAEIGAAAELFLGVDPLGRGHFAARTREPEDALKARGLLVIDLRTLAVQGAVTAPHLGMLGQAKSLVTWHGTHTHCARCGQPTRIAQSGWRRDCTACSGQHFPRTDPVAIMLIHRGERCLLARKRLFAAGMVSCLAGFIEPGETIEDAVRRESFEEAGIRIGRVSYHASQPWPLPFGQLMIGCMAEALTEEITLELEELEEGRWFTREECRLMLAGKHPQGYFCPPPAAIANTLLRAWVEG